MKKFLCLCIFAAGTFLLRAQTELRSEIEKLLPPPECKVDIMGVAFPKRFQELTVKMQTALATNKEWMLNHIKQNAKPGEPLPYDEKLGMTKNEYEEFLALGEKKEMKKFGSVKITTTTNANIFQIHSGGELSDLDEVKINLKELTITTPFGVITNLAPDTSEGGGVIGPFSGYEGKFENGDEDFNNATTISFLVGRQKNTGKNFIYYKVGILKSKNAVKDTRTLILYNKSKL